MQTELIVQAEKFPEIKDQVINIPTTIANDLIETFTPFLNDANKTIKEASSIKVESENDIEAMLKAREYRLQLKKIRSSLENERVKKKENSKLIGKAIDGIANYIKLIIIPNEKKLQDHEDYMENIEKERKTKLVETRETELSKYETDTSFYDLGEMPDEQYQQLLNNSITSFNAIEAQRQKEEKERIERERLEQQRQKEIQEENERLKKEAAERDRLAEIERKKQEKIEAVRKAKEDTERKQHEAELEKERKAREKIEAELKAKREADELAERERIEKERVAKEVKEKAEKEAKLAPDKEKLLTLAITIEAVQYPILENNESNLVLNTVRNHLCDAVKLIRSIK